MASARAIGAIAVDPTAELSRLSPGAAANYLPGGHLSAKGHDIVAKAVARAIAGGAEPPSNE